MSGIEATGALLDPASIDRFSRPAQGLTVEAPPGSLPMPQTQAFDAALAIDRAPAVGASDGIGSQLNNGLRTLHDNVTALQTQAIGAASPTAALRTSASYSPGPAVLGATSGEPGGVAQPAAEGGNDPMRDYLAASAEQRALTLKTAIHALAIDVAHSTATSVKSSVDKLMQG